MSKASTPLALGAPIMACALSVYVAHLNGVHPSTFLPNVIAILLGIAIFVLCRRYPSVPPSISLSVAIISYVALILATLLFPGIDGVRRWAQIGPVAIHISMLVAPFLLYRLQTGSLATNEFGLFIFGVAVLHALQPDAGQATAYALAASFILFSRVDRPLPLRLFGAAVLISAAALTWTRPDRLEPVLQVEKILHSIHQAGIGYTLLAILFSFTLLAPFWGTGFFIYLLTSFAVTELGHFPVPVFGAGFASTFAWYMMYALARPSNQSKESK